MESESDFYNQIKTLLNKKAFVEAKNSLYTGEAEKNLSLQDLLYLQAVSHRYCDEVEKAINRLDSLISKFPNYGRAYQELGYCYLSTEDLDKSNRAFTRAAYLNPSLHASWMMLLNLSNSSSEIVKLAESNIVYLKDLPPELKSVLSFIYEKKLLKADHLCRSFLQKNPHNVEGMRLLANIGLELSIYEDAEFLLESCIEFEPNNLRANFDYLKVLLKRQKYELAVVHARKLSKKQPESLPIKKILANALNGAGYLDDALALYKSILGIEKNNSEIYLSIGHIEKTQGLADKAIISYKNAYKDNPHFGEAFWSLANLKTYHFSEDEISNLIKMTNDRYVNEQERKYMHFALGNAFETNGEYEKAFKQFVMANKIQNKTISYTQDLFSKECASQKKISSSNIFEIKSDWGSTQDDPIFILGLPRSGSTLIEQILASHSQVDGTHELPNILSIAHKLNLRQKYPNHRYPDVLLAMSSPEIKELADNYLNGAKIFRDKAKYFTDKMPNNFRHIALIRLMFPNAKIIDARRDPMDTCWSCFKQFFAEGQEFTYDLDNIFHYYSKYLELMDAWHKALPGYILTVQHENLLDNPEEAIKNILSFCNLDFEKECLSFYENKRPVKTASSEQVRQPLNKKGVGRWKKYEEFLNPLRQKYGF